MRGVQRSDCPINLTLETLGDRWSLIVIRDIIFGDLRHFRELLAESQEGIATNILADRLKRLTAGGFLTRADDPSHKQRGIYSLTEKAIQLVPMLATMSSWGLQHCEMSQQMKVRSSLPAEGGPKLWTELMNELREAHLNGGTTPPPIVVELQRAYEAEAARLAAPSSHSDETSNLEKLRQ